MPGQLGDPVEISGAKGTADVTVSRPGTLPLSPVNSSARTQKNVWSSAPRTRWSCCFRTRRNPHGGAAEREAAHLKRRSVRIIMPHKTQRRWLSTPKLSMSVNPVIVVSSQAPETREHSSFLLYYPPKSSLRGQKIFLQVRIMFLKPVFNHVTEYVTLKQIRFIKNIQTKLFEKDTFD